MTMPTGGGQGRDTKCTEDVVAVYLEAVRFGLSLESCCAEAGICSSTLSNWRKRGEAGEEPFASFLANEKKAQAVWERRRLEAMDEAGPNWTREAWKLERRKPEAYGKRDATKIELTGDGGGPVKHEHTGSALERLSGAIARLAAAGAETTGDGEPD